MIETLRIAQPWIYSTLTSDPEFMSLLGGPVSGSLSAEPLGPRYATILMYSTRDVSVVGGMRLSTDNLYTVKAVIQTSSWDDLLPVVERMEFLLHRPREVIEFGGGSLTCIKERTIEMPEESDGIQYRHLGGIYRIRASADA